MLNKCLIRLPVPFGRSTERSDMFISILINRFYLPHFFNDRTFIILLNLVLSAEDIFRYLPTYLLNNNTLPHLSSRFRLCRDLPSCFSSFLSIQEETGTWSTYRRTIWNEGKCVRLHIKRTGKHEQTTSSPCLHTRSPTAARRRARTLLHTSYN